jgi:uncharacterized protein YciI
LSQTGPVTTYFAVILKPVEGRDLSLPLLQKHAQHLAELDEQRRLVMAGPFVDSPLGLLILKGSSKAEITQILNEDPLVQGGVRTFEVATWLMADRGNNFMPALSDEDSRQRTP